MQVYALTSSQLLHETLDLFVTREDAEAELAEAELREILLDESPWIWRDMLRVEPPIELRRAGLVGELGAWRFRRP